MKFSEILLVSALLGATLVVLFFGMRQNAADYKARMAEVPRVMPRDVGDPWDPSSVPRPTRNCGAQERTRIRWVAEGRESRDLFWQDLDAPVSLSAALPEPWASVPNRIVRVDFCRHAPLDLDGNAELVLDPGLESGRNRPRPALLDGSGERLGQPFRITVEFQPPRATPQASGSEG